MEKKLAISDGKIIDAALELPALLSSPIIEVGNNCILEQLITTSITIFLLALLDPSCILFIALIPSGVAAPFIPSMLALIFILTSCLLSFDKDFLPKIKSISGDNILEITTESFVCSSMLNIPVHTAYTAHKLKQRLTALLDEIVRAGSMLSGFINNKTEILVKIIMSQTLFMVQYMMKIKKYEENDVNRYTCALIKLR